MNLPSWCQWPATEGAALRSVVFCAVISGRLPEVRLDELRQPGLAEHLGHLEASCGESTASTPPPSLIHGRPSSMPTRGSGANSE